MNLIGDAEKIVQTALDAGADGAEAYLEKDTSLSLDIENNTVASAGRDRSEGGSIRVIKDGRIGFAFFTRQGDIDQTIERALRLSKLAPEKEYTFLPQGRLPRLGRRWDDDIARLEVSTALAAAKDMIRVVQDAHPDATAAGGGVGLSAHDVAISNSEGLAVSDSFTEASIGINVVVTDGERSLNTWDSIDAHVGIPDGQTLASQVCEEALSLRGPQQADGGAKDVVFRPDAVTELIHGLVVGAVLGDDAKRGKTVWSDRLGSQVSIDGLSIHDDPLRNGAIGVQPFDGDGTPARSVPILEHGVLRNFLFDWRDAAWHGHKTTASAVRSGFKAPPSVGTHHLVVSGRSAKQDAAIIESIDDGYLVGSILGAHTANATTGDFSVTAPNVWRIRSGEIVSPSTEIAIGGNLPDLLHHVAAVGAEPKQMSGALVPALHISGVQVST